MGERVLQRPQEDMSTSEFSILFVVTAKGDLSSISECAPMRLTPDAGTPTRRHHCLALGESVLQLLQEYMCRDQCAYPPKAAALHSLPKQDSGGTGVPASGVTAYWAH